MKIIFTLIGVVLLTSCSLEQKDQANQQAVEELSMQEQTAESNNPLRKDVVYIPAARFKNYLLNNNAININKDDEIQITEAQAFIRHAKGFV